MAMKKRPTPIRDLLKERPLIGIFAETPEEIRAFRRSLAAAVISGLFLASAYAALLTAALPKPKTAE